MENIKLTKKDLISLKELFDENYLILKQIKNEEKKDYSNEEKLLFKNLKEVHIKNLTTIMKVLDIKERIL